MRICFLLLITAFALGFVSCVSVKQHYYYFQNPHQVTLFKEKNEVRLSGNLSIGKDNAGVGAQGAYSITDKFAVTISGMTYSNLITQSVNGVNTGSWKGRCFDVAFGYYKDLEKFGLFEVYGGFAYGKQEHAYSSIHEEWANGNGWAPYISQTVIPIGTADFVTNKYFIQPSYGYSFDAIDIVISPRISYLNFASVHNNITPGNFAYNEVRDFTSNKDYLLFEPAITFRAGGKYAKFQMQYAYNGMAVFSRSRYTVSCGLQIAIAKRFRKTEQQEMNVFQE